ncbi:MAG: UPF0721 transmembrane protein [Chitinophagales bacterium]|nr:MAG: UPF0721 transmembrane protein [Chitinophagales bacterium]
MHVLGYLGAIVMGIMLGLTGSGGAILTVPILVYLFHIPAVIATGYSLFVVALTSSVGFVQYYRQGNVHLKTALLFSVPSMISIFLARKTVHVLPEVLLRAGTFELTTNHALLTFFALMMIAASYYMIKNSVRPELPITNTGSRYNYSVLLQGVLIGFFTGLVGSGGGFMIVPALVLFSNIPIKMAVGTSLLTICLNSMMGFLGDLSSQVDIQWFLLLSFSFLSVVGILVGSSLSRLISSARLKPAFGYFILIMGIAILIKELFIR